MLDSDHSNVALVWRSHIAFLFTFLFQFSWLCTCQPAFRHPSFLKNVEHDSLNKFELTSLYGTPRNGGCSMILHKAQVRAMSTRRRVAVVLFLFFLCFLFTHLPSPSLTQNDTRSDDKPHFLYQSPFRESPDYQYEKELSNALKTIEQSVLAENHGNRTSESRIWQVAISQTIDEKEFRGADSRALEETNSEWMYNVRLVLHPRPTTS